MLAAATEEARAEVTAKLMKAHDRARMRWYKEESAKVRAEVEAAYEALPVVRAFRVLSGRQTIDGQPVPEALPGIKDRTRVEQGKRVSVRVDLGGRRIIKKTIKQAEHKQP